MKRSRRDQEELMKDSLWTSPRKIEARSRAVFEVYKDIFGRDSIPKDKQYWTMGGKHYTDDFKPADNTELDHALKSHIIQRKGQFYSAENIEEINKNNKSVIRGPHWIYNDFTSAISEAIFNQRFNPAIINFDTPREPTTKDVREDVASLLFQLTKAIQRNEIGDFLFVMSFTLRKI
jgi:hypothetical protein